MINTGYFACLHKYPQNETFLVVSRTYPRWLKKGYSWHPELAPSPKLLKDWKNGGISWQEYTRRYKEEMKTPQAQDSIINLATWSAADTFRLLCYEKEWPCHRFILKELIEKVEESMTLKINGAVISPTVASNSRKEEEKND